MAKGAQSKEARRIHRQSQEEVTVRPASTCMRGETGSRNCGETQVSCAIDSDALMVTTFAKAPLIELIAELRWVPQGSSILSADVPGQEATRPGIFIGGAKQEDFYSQIGRELYHLGFDRSQRLLPMDVPFSLHQAVYRYQSEREGQSSVLYQVGYGIFSIHAIPPYHSWEQFLPFVRTGVEILLKTRPEDDRPRPFSQSSLRYIDFFNRDLIGEHSIASFVTDVLKIPLKLPVPVLKVAASNELRSFFTKIVVPVGIGDLTLNVGDGQFNNQPGILLDTMISATTETASDFMPIMNMYNSAYSIIHNVFFEMTRPIHDLMEPREPGT